MWKGFRAINILFLFEFFINNDLISSNQSGFKTGDACLNQLSSIAHDINQSLDDGPEVRAVYLAISKAFDSVWHDDLIFKLRQNGVTGKVLNILTDFLKARKKRLTVFTVA